MTSADLISRGIALFKLFQEGNAAAGNDLLRFLSEHGIAPDEIEPGLTDEAIKENIQKARKAEENAQALKVVTDLRRALENLIQSPPHGAISNALRRQCEVVLLYLPAKADT